MEIENHFDLPLPPAAAWPLLMDVPRTAACFPGASHIEQINEDRFGGRVTVKLGPLAMVFAGNLHLENRDDVAHSATVRASWSETRGRGNANTVTRFNLQTHDSGTRVALVSELQLAGQVAQYGRGVGMISALSAQLIATFAKNLRASLQGAGVGKAAPKAGEIAGLTLIARALGSRLKN